QVVFMVEEDYPLTNEQIEAHFRSPLNESNIDIVINRIDGSRYKFVEAQEDEFYDDGLYRGELEEYLYSGELIPPHTKYVTDSIVYNNRSESMRNTYRSRYNSGYYDIDYNKDGYVGTLTGTSFN